MMSELRAQLIALRADVSDWLDGQGHDLALKRTTSPHPTTKVRWGLSLPAPGTWGAGSGLCG